MSPKVRLPRDAAIRASKIFPIGKLFRSADGAVKGAKVPRARSSVTGIGKGKQLTRKLNQRQAWKRAENARDDLHRRLANDVRNGKRLPRGKKTVITGATDPSTGLSAGGHNFKADGDWGCAEKNALDNLNAERRAAGYHPDLEPHQVDFSKATNVTDRDGNVVDPPGFEKPICARYCQDRTLPDQYPNDVRYESPGPWDNVAQHGRRNRP